MDIPRIRLVLPVLVLLPVGHACGDSASAPPTLDYVAVEPREARTTAPGDSVRFRAFAALSDGTRESVEPTWSSSRPDVVEIRSDGWATGLTKGAAIIEAVYEGESAIAFFVIDPDTVAPALLDAFADETTVGLAQGSVTVLITAEFRDVGSGTKSVLGVFDGPSGGGISSVVTFALVSEDVDPSGTVGVFEGFLTIPALTGAGTWTLATLRADDRRGNIGRWSAADLEELGLTVRIVASTGNDA